VLLLLLSGAPAIALGLAAGIAAARRGWSVTSMLVGGSIVCATLVAYRSAGTAVQSPEGNGSMTAALWGVLAIVNAGCWCLGIGAGAAATRPRLAR
jgi:hypothetical protein